MTVKILDIGEPFFALRHVTDEKTLAIEKPAIVLNLAEAPVKIETQSLAFLNSVIVQNTALEQIERALIIERFADYPNEALLFEEVKKYWPLAYDIRKEERLKGVEHYLSPKASETNMRFSMYHSGSMPLNVGLHKDHPFCPVPGFREVHTQIIGFGKMQQCRERDLSTLYMEELMAPGHTHRPMYDEAGNYPWHQYETITPSIFMAVEILPEGVMPPTSQVS